MTDKEALSFAEDMLSGLSYRLECANKVPARSYYEKQEEMLVRVVYALREKQERKQLWHDAKVESPPRNGMYYGAKDDTNSMWAVRYKDGIWTLSAYPDQVMQITRWAYWDAFSREEPEANTPLTLAELRGMDGEPVWVEFIGKPDGSLISPLWMLVNVGRKQLVTDVEYVDWSDEGWIAYRRPPEQ